MKKKVKTKNMKSREEFSNPYLINTIEERLDLSNSIDLTNNHTIETDGHYLVIKPIDKTKRMKKKD